MSSAPAPGEPCPRDPADSFESLLAAARNGDRAAHDRLFERIYPRLARVAHWLMVNEVRLRRPWLSSLFSTGDVVQDICHRVLLELHKFEADSERALLSWLTVAVRNRLFDVFRFHEAVRRDCRRAIGWEGDVDVLEPRPGPATQALNDDLATSFQRVAATLPARERELLRLRVEDAEAFEKVAIELGYPSADAARKALYVAQAKLLVRLRSAGLAPGVDT